MKLNQLLESFDNLEHPTGKAAIKHAKLQIAAIDKEMDYIIPKADSLYCKYKAQFMERTGVDINDDFLAWEKSEEYLAYKNSKVVQRLVKIRAFQDRLNATIKI